MVKIVNVADINLHTDKKVPIMISDLSEIQQEYVDWIETLAWDFWCTGTTSYALSTAGARRLISRFQSVTARTLGTNADVEIFWVAEPFDLKEGHHLHWLMRVTPDVLRYQDYYQIWQAVSSKRMGWHRIQMEKFRPKIGAGGYCSKYIMKAHSDYDII